MKNNLDIYIQLSKKGDLFHFFTELEGVIRKCGVCIKYFHIKGRNRYDDKHNWYVHNYDHLLQNNNYLQK